MRETRGRREGDRRETGGRQEGDRRETGGRLSRWTRRVWSKRNKVPLWSLTPPPPPPPPPPHHCVSEQQEQLYTWAAVSQPPHSMEHFEGRLPAQVRGLWPSVRAGAGEPDRTGLQRTDSGTESDHTHPLLSAAG